MRRPDLGSYIVSALALLVLAGFFAAHRTNDFDVLWHVRTGDWIVSEHGVATTDPFGALSAGRPWLDVAWGAQVPMALVHSLAGLAGLHLAMISIVLATLAVLLWRAPRTPAVLLGGLLLVSLGWPRFLVRPDVLTLPLVAVLFSLLDRLERRDRSTRTLVALAGLTVLWANLHGSFVLAPLFAGAAALGALGSLATRRAAPVYALACVVTLLASFVNPRGPKLAALFLPYVQSVAAALGLVSSQGRLAIGEWAPLWRTGPGELVFPWVPFLLLTSLVALSFWGVGRKFSAPRLAIVVSALALAVLAVRNQLAFATVALSAIRANERDRLQGAAPRRLALADDPPVRIACALAVALLAGVLSLQVASDRFYVSRGLPYTTGVGIDLDLAPEGAARWIAAHDSPGVTFNSFESGAYLLYRLYPRFHPYSDARVVDADALRRIHRALADPDRFDALVAEDGIGTIVLLHPSSESALLLPRLVADPRWTLAYRDGNVTIHVRSDLPPPSPRQPSWTLATPSDPLGDRINARLASLKRSTNPVAELTDAYVSGTLRDRERERDAYRRALARAPGDATALAYFREHPAAVKPRRLRMLNLHTNERIDVVFDDGSSLVPEALDRIDHFLRDYRTGESKRMDPELLELVHELADAIGKPEGEFQIISGYRSPATNAALKEQGHAVATRSMHCEGKAIDLRMPGVDIDTLRKAALDLRRGGVGLYRADGFVHVDIGRVRKW